MKKTLIWLISVLFLLVAAPGAENVHYSPFKGVVFEDEGFSIDLHGGTVVLKQDNGRDNDIVEITDDNKLYINGDEIKLNAEQRDLVKEFHGVIYDIVDEGKAIGLEGAKMGIDGVKVAFTAVIGVIKMIGPDYDEDDLEAEVDEVAQVLEDKAELLEKRANVIEDMAEDLEDIFYEMEESIPELADLHMEWPN